MERVPISGAQHFAAERPRVITGCAAPQVPSIGLPVVAAIIKTCANPLISFFCGVLLFFSPQVESSATLCARFSILPFSSASPLSFPSCLSPSFPSFPSGRSCPSRCISFPAFSCCLLVACCVPSCSSERRPGLPFPGPLGEWGLVLLCGRPASCASSFPAGTEHVFVSSSLRFRFHFHGSNRSIHSNPPPSPIRPSPSLSVPTSHFASFSSLLGLVPQPPDFGEQPSKPPAPSPWLPHQNIANRTPPDGLSQCYPACSSHHHGNLVQPGPAWLRLAWRWLDSNKHAHKHTAHSTSSPPELAGHWRRCKCH